MQPEYSRQFKMLTRRWCLMRSWNIIKVIAILCELDRNFMAPNPAIAETTRSQPEMWTSWWHEFKSQGITSHKSVGFIGREPGRSAPNFMAVNQYWVVVWPVSGILTKEFSVELQQTCEIETNPTTITFDFYHTQTCILSIFFPFVFISPCLLISWCSDKINLLLICCIWSVSYTHTCSSPLCWCVFLLYFFLFFFGLFARLL